MSAGLAAHKRPPVAGLPPLTWCTRAMTSWAKVPLCLALWRDGPEGSSMGRKSSRWRPTLIRSKDSGLSAEEHSTLQETQAGRQPSGAKRASAAKPPAQSGQLSLSWTPLPYLYPTDSPAEAPNSSVSHETSRTAACTKPVSQI